MPWYAWALAVTIGVSSFCKILLIDKPREPLGAGTVALDAVFNAAAIVAIVVLATRH